MKKLALISVFDKTGILEFARKLVSFGYEIVSTDGTQKFLMKNGIDALNTDEFTGFTQLLGGKVKTLHPAIHAGILADVKDSKELEEIKTASIEPFSMVVVNLYPFEEVAAKNGDLEELVKNIDIGGVTMLRAAAKNHANVLTVSEIGDYERVIAELVQNNSQITQELRNEFATKAFLKTSGYDAAITEVLSDIFELDGHRVLYLEKLNSLRYGENPHQKSAIYKQRAIADYELLNGKELSYNNVTDTTAAVNVVSEFFDVAAVAIVKHGTPCGAALGKNIADAYNKAFDADPISAFGGIIAFTQCVDMEIAKHASSVFLEVLIAPDYTPEALELLKTKKNLRIIKLNTSLREYNSIISEEIKVTPFGTLIQCVDNKQLDKDLFKVVTKKGPSAEMVEDMVFAFKVAKHAKSNAIVVAKDLKTLGISAGQTSRIDAIEAALSKVCDSSKDAVIASDGFFPAVDSIHAGAQCRIAGIIQPGGSIKDAEVIQAADKYEMVMVTTGIRHFKH